MEVVFLLKMFAMKIAIAAMAQMKGFVPLRWKEANATKTMVAIPSPRHDHTSGLRMAVLILSLMMTRIYIHILQMVGSCHTTQTLDQQMIGLR